MKKWEDLPKFVKNDKVKVYYDILNRHRMELVIKRWFDFFVALVLTVILLPVLFVIGIMIKVDSKGSVIFRQARVTSYGKVFQICKFRTMTADQTGNKVTVKDDPRITKVGRVLRKYRLDELPQLFNVLSGDMSFVGTRPEVVKYVKCYTDEMKATLLLPAGITSLASIKYKDEEKLLTDVDKADEIYVKEILPEKMKYNLEAIRNFSLVSELNTMIATVKAVVSNK